MDQDVSLEDDRQLKGKVQALEYALEAAVKDSKGPMTKKGRFIDYGESHTVEIALGLTVLGYVLSGAWLGIHLLLALKALYDHYGKKTATHPLLEQIATEFHYYVGTTAITVGAFEYAGYSPPDLPITFTNVVRVLLGL